MKVQVFSDCVRDGKNPEILFWVGCSGSFDERAKKITKAFVKILNDAKIDFAILGNEESCSGDPAKRSGNEFLFQMQALGNIKVINSYNIKKIVTACPHCFNTIKNEYPGLGGKYEVLHHTEFLKNLIEKGKLKIPNGSFRGKKITYHDPCYLGRANNIYEIPRDILKKLDAELVEMKSYKSKGLCCGAGGAQMFKEPEKGNEDVKDIRIKQALETNPDIIAAACPFCNTMLSDGLKDKVSDDSTSVLDISQIIEKAKGL